MSNDTYICCNLGRLASMSRDPLKLAQKFGRQIRDRLLPRRGLSAAYCVVRSTNKPNDSDRNEMDTNNNIMFKTWHSSQWLHIVTHGDDVVEFGWQR